jgi:hypothetical protein
MTHACGYGVERCDMCDYYYYYYYYYCYYYYYYTSLYVADADAFVASVAAPPPPVCSSFFSFFSSSHSLSVSFSFFSSCSFFSYSCWFSSSSSSSSLHSIVCCHVAHGIQAHSRQHTTHKTQQTRRAAPMTLAQVSRIMTCSTHDIGSSVSNLFNSTTVPQCPVIARASHNGAFAARLWVDCGARASRTSDLGPRTSIEDLGPRGPRTWDLGPQGPRGPRTSRL